MSIVSPHRPLTARQQQNLDALACTPAPLTKYTCATLEQYNAALALSDDGLMVAYPDPKAFGGLAFYFHQSYFVRIGASA